MWAHPLPRATIPPGAWHRCMPPCLCAPWHPSHSLICHSLTLAPSTDLAHGRQLSGPGQHSSPLPFSHLNGVFSILRDINCTSTCVSCCCKFKIMLLIHLQKCIICLHRKLLAKMSPPSFYVQLYIMVVRISVDFTRKKIEAVFILICWFAVFIVICLLLCSVEVHFKCNT